MIDGKSVLAIIPARGGSKGLPGKNIKPLSDKPLIAWTIEEAKKSEYIDRLILSSEDKEIISIAKRYGCEVPFIRPQELARDDTPGIESVFHAIQTLPEKYDYVVLLQPTSPLRTVQDIDGCIAYCIQKKAPCCVSVTEPDKSPYWMFHMNSGGRLKPFSERKDNFSRRRQELPEVFALNGAVYVADTEILKEKKTFIQKETVGFLMPKLRSVDIDTELDFMLAEFLLDKLLTTTNSVNGSERKSENL